MKINELDSFCFSIIACDVIEIYEYLLKDRYYQKIMYVEVDVEEIFFEGIYQNTTNDIQKGLIYKPDIVQDFTIVLGSNRDFLDTLSQKLSLHFGVKSILMEFNTEKSEIIRNGFSVYGGGSSEKVREILGLWSSFGEMEFVDTGKILDFENSVYYERDKVADKINKEIILEYGKKLGVDIGDDRIFATNDKSIFIDQET
jgi:hypothetical protein